MAKAADYGLGPNTFPRGWFIVAESKELDAGPMAVRFFGQDLALYRGESGRPVMLDAYCAHMGTAPITAGAITLQATSMTYPTSMAPAPNLPPSAPTR